MLTAQHYFSSPRGGSTWLPPVAILGHTRDGEKGLEALVRLLGRSASMAQWVASRSRFRKGWRKCQNANQGNSPP